MKIAVFIKSTTFHKNSGGLESQNKVLCEGLTKRGHNVTIFSPKKELKEDSMIQKGVKYVFIDSEYKKYLFSKFNKNSWTKKSLEVFSKIDEVERFDVVLGQSASAESILENKVSLGVKTVSIAHGTASAEFFTFIKNISGLKDTYWLLRNTQYFLRQYFGRQRNYVLHSDRVVAVSNYVKQSLISETFVDAGRVRVIHNGVDPSLFVKVGRKSGEDSPVNLLFVGRVDKSKGILTMVDILKDLDRNVVLHIIGDGSCMEELKSRIDKYSMGEKIVLHGRKTLPEIGDFISEVNPDISVFPTQRIEGFPMTIVESMIAGIPVVAFNLGGVPDAIVDGKTGYLVKPGDLKGFTDRLKDLIDDRDLRLKFGENSRNKAEKEFTIDIMIDEYEKVLMEVLN